MSQLLAQNILTDKDESELNLGRFLRKALYDKNIEMLIETFNHLLASIPHNNFDEAARQDIRYKGYEMTTQEWLCRTCLFAFLQGCGVVVSSEVQTNKGKADLVIQSKGNYFVIEIKMLSKSSAKQALQQIIDKGYAKPYPNAVLLGLVIDDEKRQIVEVETEFK